MKKIDIIFFIIGFIVSILFVIICLYINDTWSDIVIPIILMGIFYLIAFFIVDYFDFIHNSSILNYLFYAMTVLSLFIAIMTFLNKNYRETSSSMTYIPYYLAFLIYSIRK